MRQKIAWQKQASLSADVAAKKKSRRIDKELVKVARKVLSEKWKESVRKRLKTQSRHQALEKLVPRASLAKAKAVKKSSLKKQKGKSLKKHESVKQLKDVKKDGAAALTSDSSRAIEDKAAQLPNAEHGLLFGKKVRLLCLDQHCGKEGKCTAHNLISGECTVISIGDTLATRSVNQLDLVEVEPDWKKPLKWKALVLSRVQKREILRACGSLLLLHELPVSEFMVSEPVEELLPKKIQMLLNQHVSFGWHLLKWHFSGFCESENVQFLDPLLVKCLADPALAVENQFCSEEAIPAMKEYCTQVMRTAGAVFVPVYGDNPCHHWTLIVILLGSVCTVNYMDSLPDEHPQCRKHASAVLSILLPDKTLRAREGTEKQEGDDCGFWILAFTLETLALLRGEGPRSRGLTRSVVIDLKTTMRTWLRTLSEEQKKSEKELASEQKATEDNLKKAEATAAQLLKKKSVQGEELKQLRSLAEKLLKQGQEPTLADLPASARIEIEEVSRSGYGICSRCRWSSGCLACSVKHAQRYHLNKLRASLGLPALKVLPDQD